MIVHISDKDLSYISSSDKQKLIRLGIISKVKSDYMLVCSQSPTGSPKRRGKVMMFYKDDEGLWTFEWDIKTGMFTVSANRVLEEDKMRCVDVDIPIGSYPELSKILRDSVVSQGGRWDGTDKGYKLEMQPDKGKSNILMKLSGTVSVCVKPQLLELKSRAEILECLLEDFRLVCW